MYGCRWYEFLEDSCEDTEDEEGNCIAGQIADSTAPGLWAEEGWPCLRAPVAFLAGRELHDGPVMQVAFVLSPFVLFSLSHVFFHRCLA